MRRLFAAGLLLAASLAHADPVALTPEERQWIASAAPVTVGVQSDSAPYSFVDASGRPTGYSNEMFRLVARRTGLRYSFDEGRLWDALWAKARRGEVDVLTFLWKTPDREPYLRFVEPPYITHTLAFWVRADDRAPPTPEATGGRVIALGRDFAINPELRARFPDARFVEADSAGEALRLVSTGKADAYVDERGTLNYLTAELGITNLREGAALPTNVAASHMAVVGDAAMLHAILTKGLASVSAQERRQLAAQWLDPRLPTARRIAPYVAQGLPLLPFALLALGWLVYSHRRLSREVGLRRAAEAEAAARADQLAERESFQRELVDAAQAAVLVMDHAGRWVIYNRFAESLLGWQASEVLGRTVREKPPSSADPDASPHLLHPEQVVRSISVLDERVGEHVPPDWRAIHRYAELGLPPQRVDLAHRDGHRVPALVSLASVQGPDGRPRGVIVIANDLSEQVRLEDELRASEARERDANRAKSSFLAAMSHEIRTPMIGITGMVEILGHTRLDADQRHALAIMQSSAQALLEVLGDILDFSKIEAERIELNPVATDLRGLVEGTVASFAGAASSKGLTLSCEVDPRLAAAYQLDRLRFRQILSNLLTNAIKFTDAGGVQVALARIDGDGGQEHVIDLRVTDSGRGIEPAQRERLFQPFVQGDGEPNRRYGGTGLGLVICRRLAELMGGSVELLASGRQGSTFQMRLRLAPASVSEIEAEREATADFTARTAPDVDEAERNRSLVLLVDDHPTNRLVISRQLALAGYASEGAASGEEGLARWLSGRYALVLTDVHMPDMDGYEMARRMRLSEAERGWPRTPIVALTASALKGEAERCRAAGMDDYLSKPVGVATLGAMLARWLPHTAATAVTDPESGNAGDGVDEAGAVAVMDSEALHSLLGGDAAAARSVVEDFMESQDQDLDALGIAVAGHEREEAARQAHRIHGAARAVGAIELASASSALEGALRDGDDWGDCEALLRDVRTADSRLRAFLLEAGQGRPDRERD